MRVIVVEDYAALSQKAASLTADQIRQNPRIVLGLATGSTPLGLYQEWVEMYKQGTLDFSRVRTFNLDEYVGLAPEHEQSYHTYMQQNLFSQVNLRPEHTHIPSAYQADLTQVCKEYDERIEAAGGIDIQILGIGANGHIGFNEPGTDPGIGTHIVQLAETTIQANSRFFARLEEVPGQAVTMGIRTIMKNSRQILLLAYGEEKAEAVRRMIHGDISANLPASYLQLHPSVTVIVEKKAAHLLDEIACGTADALTGR
ncbi:glucosamine-6-phosphate deaminase [Brevibacillus dissolubilis]|uniref:glucosamine-6-phosphate deaminase n=1 Tax=Brevibacillus dissolubilis TaxID=1844116 RepID=UPI00111654D2|nr:glucosamine-6-phosphate deaminase [Brevibacillus dissolubilis]